ncbi:MAG: ATPase, T2SS/T4P/T4SS family, partial [Planctomycetota bacterium]
MGLFTSNNPSGGVIDEKALRSLPQAKPDPDAAPKADNESSPMDVPPVTPAESDPPKKDDAPQAKSSLFGGASAAPATTAPVVPEAAKTPYKTAATPAPARPAMVRPVADERQQELDQLKRTIHKQLVERLDMTALRKMKPELVRKEVSQIVREMASQQAALISGSEQGRIIEEVLDETFGFGPLETILKDKDVSDILVNRHDQIYVERKGRLTVSETVFRDEKHLRQIIDRIVAGVGRRIDETSPMVDARLPDGSRVNAIIPPLALDGSSISIRRFGSKPLQLEDLLRYQAFPPVVMDFLSAAVQARCNILISGGTGSGKTTLLNCLSRYIPSGERVITCEDAAELQLQQPHVVRLETRPANIEGKGEVTARDLV